MWDTHVNKLPFLFLWLSGLITKVSAKNSESRGKIIFPFLQDLSSWFSSLTPSSTSPICGRNYCHRLLLILPSLQWRPPPQPFPTVPLDLSKIVSPMPFLYLPTALWTKYNVSLLEHSKYWWFQTLEQFLSTTTFAKIHWSSDSLVAQ